MNQKDLARHWQEIKMLCRWGVASFLLARAMGLVEKEQSPTMAVAFMVIADELEKFELEVTRKTDAEFEARKT
jgi:hypothetical protein